VLFRSYKEEAELEKFVAKCQNKEDCSKKMAIFKKRFFCPPKDVFVLDSSSAYVALPKESLKSYTSKTTTPVIPISLKLSHVLSDSAWYENYYNEASDSKRDVRNLRYPYCFEADEMDYYRFLALVYLYPEEAKCFHPNYFTDLMWHVHQLRPVIYKNDCEEFYGSILDHDPWPEKSTKVCDEEEKRMMHLWEETFKKISQPMLWDFS